MKKIFFETLSKLWLKNKIHYVKISTYSLYSMVVHKHLIPFFGDKKIINSMMVQEYVNLEFIKGLKKKTIKDSIIILNMIIKYGVNNNLFYDSHIDYQIPNNEKQNDIECLDIDTSKILINYLKNNITYKNLGIYISLLTGIRIGEVCALKYSDINFERGTICISRTLQRVYCFDNANNSKTNIYIGSTKTKNSTREIPLAKELLDILLNLNGVFNTDNYILTNNQKPLEPATYRVYFYKLLTKLKIPKIKFHGLRHSFATRCIESNCDYKTVSNLLGHSNISTTLNLYVHPNLELKRRCINKISKALT